MAIALQVIGGFLFVYSLLIALRIILVWFQGPSGGRAWEMLGSLTDPYLRSFRRIKVLRQGMFDFSPIAAVLVLVVLQNIVASLAAYGTLRLGDLLAVILRAVWGSVSWIGFFFFVLGVVRLVSLRAARNANSPLWHTIDLMVQPLAGWVSRLFGSRHDYAQSLVVTVVLIAVCWMAGVAIVAAVAGALHRLPF